MGKNSTSHRVLNGRGLPSLLPHHLHAITRLPVQEQMWKQVFPPLGQNPLGIFNNPRGIKIGSIEDKCWPPISNSQMEMTNEGNQIND